MADTQPEACLDDEQAVPPPRQEATDESAPEAVRRADAMMTDVGMRLGRLTARLQHEVGRFNARAREEIEDMWAEAQALRRHENTVLGPESTHGEHARDEQPVTNMPTERP
jgi:hypothetical protein